VFVAARNLVLLEGDSALPQTQKNPVLAHKKYWRTQYSMHTLVHVLDTKILTVEICRLCHYVEPLRTATKILTVESVSRYSD
jgi:hypothetical protein